MVKPRKRTRRASSRAGAARRTGSRVAPGTKKAPAGVAPSTAERIVSAAITCFGTYGFAGATTRMIGEQAGVNTALIKYYFGSKDELWRAAADRAYAGVAEALGDVLSDMADFEPRDRIRVLLRRFVRFIAERPHAVRLLHDEGTHDSERMRWIVDRQLRPVYELFREIVGGLQVDGSGPAGNDPIHLFYIILGGVSFFFHQAPECHYLSGTNPRDPAVAERHADALITALLPPADGAVSQRTNDPT